MQRVRFQSIKFKQTRALILNVNWIVYLDNDAKNDVILK